VTLNDAVTLLAKYNLIEIQAVRKPVPVKLPRSMSVRNGRNVPEYKAFQARTEKTLRKLLRDVEIGDITTDEFEENFNRELKNAYKYAFRAGKGDEKLSAKDNRWINQFHGKQSGYVSGFAQDIEDGVERVPYENRIKMYANTIQAPYWKGAMSDADPDEEIYWILDETANNCGDCVAMADGSPYAPGDLTQFPGDGNTACNSNCKCSLGTFKNLG
jgi:signal recognition particle subunit SEC65